MNKLSVGIVTSENIVSYFYRRVAFLRVFYINELGCSILVH